jgi:hypothetical protein
MKVEVVFSIFQQWLSAPDSIFQQWLSAPDTRKAATGSTGKPLQPLPAARQGYCRTSQQPEVVCYIAKQQSLAAVACCSPQGSTASTTSIQPKQRQLQPPKPSDCPHKRVCGNGGSTIICLHSHPHKRVRVQVCVGYGACLCTVPEKCVSHGVSHVSRSIPK